MPIDLKWVRNHPEQVQAWQSLRCGNGLNDSSSLSSPLSSSLSSPLSLPLQRVISLDQNSRQCLQTLNRHRQRLKQLHKALRPPPPPNVKENGNGNGNKNTDTVDSGTDRTQRTQLLQERTILQTTIPSAEQEYQTAMRDLQGALWGLASPVDTHILEHHETYHDSAADDSPPRRHSRSRRGRSRGRGHEESLPPPKGSTPSSISSSSSMTAWKISQAIHAYTQTYFGTKYSKTHPLPTTAEQCAWIRQAPTTHADWLHAMWGCALSSSASASATKAVDPEATTTTTPTATPTATATATTTEETEEELPLRCSLCAMAASREPSTTPSTPEEGSAQSTPPPPPPPPSLPLLLPPAWVTWITQTIPRRSIWGAKQLPQFTILRGTKKTTSMIKSTKPKTRAKQQQQQQQQKGTHFKSLPTARNRNRNSLTEEGEETTMEILAMTSGTTWDARTVQLELVQELVTFYERLLQGVGDGSNSETGVQVRVIPQAVPATSLELHEQSRIVLVALLQNNTKVVPLGWVSNFGDAASRASELSFKGGGLQDSKEYVQLVHATILDGHGPLLTAMGHSKQKQRNQQGEGEGSMVILPSCLSPHLTPDEDFQRVSCSIPEQWSVPVEALSSTNTTAAPMAKARLGQPFSPMTYTTTKDSSSQRGAAMTLLTAPPRFGTAHPEAIRAEAVSCPFGFVL